MAAPAKLPRACLFSFLLALAAYLLAGISGIDNSCLDAADSAYLISASAIAHGAVPYRDFLAAHPPLLYLLGAPLTWLGTGVEPFRVFSLALQGAVALVTLFLALRLTRRPPLALLAGVFTLLAPVGVFFSRMFLNDSLSALLSVAMFLLLAAGRSRRTAAAAGAVAVLGTLTKLTFLPALAAGAAFVLLYRRGRGRAPLFLGVSLGGGAMAAAFAELVTNGGYFRDIFLAQGSKSLSFVNLYQGLERIWQFDWPLLLLALPGIWHCIRVLSRTRRQPAAGHDNGAARAGRESCALALLWLGAGLTPLATLPAAGHDINLFQTAEPALALMAAWGVALLAAAVFRLAAGGPVRLAGGKAAAVAAIILIAVAGAVMVLRDQSFLARSNSADVNRIVAAIREDSAPDMPVLAPGCYAFQAGRPVAFAYYDQFLWEEKYQRGDADARAMLDRIRLDVNQGRIAAVALPEDQPTYLAVRSGLERKYHIYYRSTQWPPLNLWLPDARPAVGG